LATPNDVEEYGVYIDGLVEVELLDPVSRIIDDEHERERE